jgi:serine protease Do
MNTKILRLSLALAFGLPLAASCLSLNTASCSAASQPPTQTRSVNIDNLPQQLDRASTSVAVNSEATHTPRQNTRLIAAATGEQDRIRLVAKTKDAVVKIRTADGGTGSGFIISKDGLVITNKHVVTNDKAQKVFDKATIILTDGTEIEANVLGVARHRDLALIQIPNQSRLKFLKLAKPETINVGQNVYAIGSPFGIENVFTAGVLNKIDKSDPVSLFHDARTEHGNSGGPLINSAGEVIGVNTQLIGHTVHQNDTQISAAISVDRVIELLADCKGKQNNFQSVTNANKTTELAELQTNGEAITASFKSEDETDERNVHFRNYYFEGKAKQQLTIEMSSKQIDSVLVLYFIDENRQWHELSINKGISPQNTTAKISGVLPKDGIYVLVAKTFQPRETGNYQITATLGQ